MGQQYFEIFDKQKISKINKYFLLVVRRLTAE